jgi:hypothetical protein
VCPSISRPAPPHPSDLQGPVKSVSEAFSDRLRSITSSGSRPDTIALRYLAARLDKCRRRRSARDGWRCRRAACPACQARKAKAMRRDLERFLRQPHAPLAFATLTYPCDRLDTGFETLRAGLATLRNRAAWRQAVAGSFTLIEFDLAESDGCKWNVHAHLLVELKANTLDRARVAACWQSILARRGRTGSADWQAQTSLWSWRDPSFSTLAFYVTKKQLGAWLAWSDDAFAEACTFVRGRRMFSRCGTMRGARWMRLADGGGRARQRAG